MANLKTQYIGLELAHPVVASASPLSYTLDGLKRLEDGGVSAVVLFSLFEEQIHRNDAEHDWTVGRWARASVEATGYLPLPRRIDFAPDAYLELIRQAKDALDIPVIGSLNGVTDDGWTRYARSIQEAGADAIELNVFYVPADLSMSARAVDQRQVDVASSVRRAVSIPLAVKLSPYFSSLPEVARRLLVAGADGLVLFNRFYQPDFDLDLLEVSDDLELSGPGEIRLPLLWISLLYGELPVSLAATTGVETYEEVAKYMLAGADVAMAASSLLRHGPAHAGTIVRGLSEWMDRKEFRSVAEMRGYLSQLRIVDRPAFERMNYMRILQGNGIYDPRAAAPERGASAEDARRDR
jgi:dihydroorotate dehydrogenase (fumarate)